MENGARIKRKKGKREKGKDIERARWSERKGCRGYIMRFSTGDSVLIGAWQLEEAVEGTLRRLGSSQCMEIQKRRYRMREGERERKIEEQKISWDA